MLSDPEVALWRQFFDFWRQSYDDMTYSAHQRFYNRVAETFPHQDKADRDAVESALIHASVATRKPLRVWELGGWDGALARDMIERFGDEILTWRNIEICEAAIRKSWYSDESAYAPCIPSNWIWTYPGDAKGYDIAILSHVIEHLSWDHLQRCLNMLRTVPYIYIQTPGALGQAPHPTAWMGTMSTHKLEVGLKEVQEHLEKIGYYLLWRKCNAVLYARA
jgi:hypothetical protein